MKSFTHLVEWSLFFEVSVGVCPQHARYDEELRVLKIPQTSLQSQGTFKLVMQVVLLREDWLSKGRDTVMTRVW